MFSINIDKRQESLLPPYLFNVLSESFLHLLLWPIFRQSHSNFRGGRNANASEIWAQLTKNLLTKSGTERFRENIQFLNSLLFHSLHGSATEFALASHLNTATSRASTEKIIYVDQITGHWCILNISDNEKTGTCFQAPV